MADIFSKRTRSEIMSAIRSRSNISTELEFSKLLRSEGLTGWRRHYPLVGRPDFVFTARRLAIFVDGCFWHGCPRHGKSPSSNRHFWRRKITRNRQRDREVNRLLMAKGWRVLRVWEHELSKSSRGRVAARLRSLLSI